MKKLLLIALMGALVEALLLWRSSHQNQLLQSKAQALDFELKQIKTTDELRDAELQAFQTTIAQLQDELKRASNSLNLAATAIDTKPIEITEPEPLGLTTNDVDVAGMFVVGTNTVGTLFVPITSDRLWNLWDIHHRERRMLVFGTLINTNGYFTFWGGDTNKLHGLALKFESREDAEKMATEMRGRVGQ